MLARGPWVSMIWPSWRDLLTSPIGVNPEATRASRMDLRSIKAKFRCRKRHSISGKASSQVQRLSYLEKEHKLAVESCSRMLRNPGIL